MVIAWSLRAFPAPSFLSTEARHVQFPQVMGQAPKLPLRSDLLLPSEQELP